jgi:hypothetical protein
VVKEGRWRQQVDGMVTTATGRKSLGRSRAGGMARRELGVAGREVRETARMGRLMETWAGTMTMTYR